MDENHDWQSFALACAKIIDELIVLFRLQKEDYNIVDIAFHHIARARQWHPEQPITASLVPLLKEKGLLK